jgi:hypothetical protein
MLPFWDSEGVFFELSILVYERFNATKNERNNAVFVVLCDEVILVPFHHFYGVVVRSFQTFVVCHFHLFVDVV